jgi:hypothetical protein
MFVIIMVLIKAISVPYGIYCASGAPLCPIEYASKVEEVF